MISVAVYLGLATAAVADSYTWTGGGGIDTNWSNAANWGGKSPAGDPIIELTFPPLTGPYASNNDLNNLNVSRLNVSTQVADEASTAFTGNPIVIFGPVSLSSPGTGNPNLSWMVPLTLGANVTVATSGRQTQIGAVALGASTLTFNAGGDVLPTGTVSGTGNLVKNNVSALTINGTNTYTGTTTSNNGALYLGNAAALGAAAIGDDHQATASSASPARARTRWTSRSCSTAAASCAYGTPSMAGAVTLAVPIEVEVFETESVLTIAGPVSGAGGLAATGDGRLILSSDATLHRRDQRRRHPATRRVARQHERGDRRDRRNPARERRHRRRHRGRGRRHAVPGTSPDRWPPRG